MRWTAWIGVLFLAATAFAAPPDAHPFRVRIQSDLKITASGSEQNVAAETELHYAWTRSGSEKLLSFSSLQVKLKADGEVALDSFLSRSQMRNITPAGKTEVAFEKAPPAAQEILRDTFGPPLCRIEIDAKQGTELGRKIVAGPGAKSSIENGMIENALLFHPPYFADRDSWQIERRFSMGAGGYADGTLTYTKSADEPNVFVIRGELTNPLFQPAAGQGVKDAKYVVNGKQIFDAERRAWSVGEMTADVSFTILEGEEPAGSAAGVIRLEFERTTK